MPALVSLRHLFHTDTCVAYLHMLRWKGRPLSCPQCHSYNVGSGGTYPYRLELQRYRCKACQRTLNAPTQTPLAQSKRSLAHWILTTPNLGGMACETFQGSGNRWWRDQRAVCRDDTSSL